MTLAVVPTEVLTPRSLDELAADFRREHDSALASAVQVVEHAIRAGEVLIEAKEQVPRGQWIAWLEANILRDGCKLSTATAYMRFARHQDELRRVQPATFQGAVRLLRGEADARLDPMERDEVRRLRRAGKTYKEVSKQLGISMPKVWRLANPESYEASKRKSRRLSIAGQRAERQRDRDKLMRTTGGAVADAYSLLRKSLQRVEAAHEETTDPEVRRHLASAMDRLHHAEDQIVRAVRLS